MDWQALWITLKLASLTTLILLLLSLPLSWWLAQSRWRMKFVVEALVVLPIILPPTVLGLYLLYAMGPYSPIGQAAEWATGRRLVFSFPGILIASVVYNLPFMARPLASAFAVVDPRGLEAAWCLGSGKWRTFWRIVIPSSRAGILTGAVLTFAHAVGEFGVVMMVGGGIKGSTVTASIAVYNHFNEMQFAAANQTALVLVAFSMVVLSVTYALQHRVVAL